MSSDEATPITTSTNSPQLVAPLLIAGIVVCIIFLLCFVALCIRWQVKARANDKAESYQQERTRSVDV